MASHDLASKLSKAWKLLDHGDQLPHEIAGKEWTTL